MIKKKFLKFGLIASIVAIAFFSFSGGAIYQFYEDKSIIEAQASDYELLLAKYNAFFDYSANTQDVSVEQAILWLDRAAYSHEHNLFDDDPDNDEFHQGTMDRYASIKRLLIKLDNRGE